LSIVAGLAVGMVFVRRQRALADPLIDLRLCRMPGFRGFGPTRTRSVTDPTSEAPAATDRNEQSNALDDVARKPAAWAAITAVPTALAGYFGQGVSRSLPR
jgi:hypothetical protein